MFLTSIANYDYTFNELMILRNRAIELENEERYESAGELEQYLAVQLYNFIYDYSSAWPLYQHYIHRVFVGVQLGIHHYLQYGAITAARELFDLHVKSLISVARYLNALAEPSLPPVSTLTTFGLLNANSPRDEFALLPASLFDDEPRQAAVTPPPGF